MWKIAQHVFSDLNGLLLLTTARSRSQREPLLSSQKALYHERRDVPSRSKFFCAQVLVATGSLLLAFGHSCSIQKDSGATASGTTAGKYGRKENM